MPIYTPYSDNAILIDFGKQIAKSRLNNNWTQADLANKAGVSKSTIENIEKGQSTQLLNTIKILRALGFIQQFLNIIPEQGPSPMELLKASTKQQASLRKRASKPKLNKKVPPKNIIAEPNPSWVWDEDK